MKVLMLGWEFPPVISGGLGVACHAISNELAQKVHLTLIIPQASNELIIDQMEVIGLNQQESLLTDEDEQRVIDTFESITRIKTSIEPYQQDYASQEVLKKERKVSLKTTTKQLNVGANIFSFDDLYGIALDERVIAYTKEVLKIAENKTFDIIYAHDWMTFAAGVELKKRFKKPLVVHVHSLSYDRVGVENNGWVNSLEKIGLNAADCVIPVSNYTGRICTQYYQVDYKKVYPVHNGIEKINTFKEQKAFPEKLVLFLGRVTSQKGPSLFLDIASKVLEKNKDVRFVVAGAGDQLKEVIKEGAYREIGNRLHFTGFLTKDKVHKLLAMSDVYCMPSVSEPFGLSALEAVQFGVPTVISSQSGAAEVLHGALKANYWDVDRMAKHILILLENNKIRELVVNNSLKDLDELTWKKTVARITEVFEKVV
jgi:glycogen(starch) synthase